MFQDKWGWFVSLHNLCGDDLSKQEEWLNANILEFLNQLSFKKELNAVQKLK